jgi:hypothetical protein
MARAPYDIPIQAVAEYGEVLLDGPDGVATSLTPAAARRSARDIESAADLAERHPDRASPLDSASPHAAR